MHRINVWICVAITLQKHMAIVTGGLAPLDRTGSGLPTALLHWQTTLEQLAPTNDGSDYLKPTNRFTEEQPMLTKDRTYFFKPSSLYPEAADDSLTTTDGSSIFDTYIDPAILQTSYGQSGADMTSGIFRSTFSFGAFQKTPELVPSPSVPVVLSSGPKFSMRNPQLTNGYTTVTTLFSATTKVDIPQIQTDVLFENLISSSFSALYIETKSKLRSNMPNILDPLSSTTLLSTASGTSNSPHIQSSLVQHGTEGIGTSTLSPVATDFGTSNPTTLVPGAKTLCSSGWNNTAAENTNGTRAEKNILDENDEFLFESETLGSHWIQDPWFSETAFSAIKFQESICPGSLLCNSSNSQPILKQEQYSCCSKCSCSSTCVYSGDCCLDAEGLYAGYLPHLTCVLPVFPKRSLLDIEPVDRKTYIMTEVCPDGLAEKSAVQTPVYSTVTNKTYRSKGVAMCNGETAFDLISWTPKVTCPNMFRFLFLFFGVTDLAAFIENFQAFDDCYISWIPVNVKAKECRNDERLEAGCDSCSVSGPWLENLCQRGFTAPYGHSDGQMFKNVFCFGCSYLSKSLRLDSCTSAAEERLPNLDQLPVAGTFDPAVLNSYIKDIISSINDGDLDCRCQNCNTDFVLIGGLDICARAMCSPTQVRVNGECLNTFRMISGLDVEYRVDFRVPKSLAEDMPLLSEKLGNKTYWLIKDENIRLPIIIRSKTERKTSGHGRGFVYFTQKMVRRVGVLEDLHATFYRFKQRVSSAINTEGFSPRLSRNFKLDAAHYRGSQLYFEEHALNEFPMIEFQFCDSIQIPISQYGVAIHDNGLHLGAGGQVWFYANEYYLSRAIQQSDSGNGINVQPFTQFAHICKTTFLERIRPCVNCSTMSQRGSIEDVTTSDVSLAGVVQARASITIFCLGILTIY